MRILLLGPEGRSTLMVKKIVIKNTLLISGYPVRQKTCIE